MKAKPVHVVIYDHRHGTDAAAYSSAENANMAAVDIILDNLEEVLDEQVKGDIVRLVAAHDYVKALQLWGQYQYEACPHPEGILIELLTLDATVPTPRALLIHAQKAAEGIPCVYDEFY